MKTLYQYVRMPESLDENVINFELESLLGSKDDIDFNEEWLECLYQISIRRRVNGRLNNKDLEANITNILKEFWDSESVDSTEIVIGILINLHLNDLYDFIKAALPEIKTQEVIVEIESAIDELGDDLEYINRHPC